MSTFLINASNLKAGGGIQVAQSICRELKRFENHHFVVVLSNYINDDDIDYGSNTEVYKYNINHNFRTIFFGRVEYLDTLCQDKGVNAVLTVFGPSIWIPKVPHLCGFARAQILANSGLMARGYKISQKEKLILNIWSWLFKRCSKVFYTENSFISKMLENYYNNVIVYTVSNYYNQVFDMPEKWKRSIKLPEFDGITCLSISSNYPHKNFDIIPDVIRDMRNLHPEMKVRFVLTIKEEEMTIDRDVKDSILFLGKVDVSECPSLYEQADVMFMPTLLECFTATYPEAMRMDVPIVTTDMEFARGLCEDAACYYSALNAKAATEAIYKVVTDKDYASKLVENGKRQLLKYDNYEQRADKLIHILEEISV